MYYQDRCSDSDDEYEHVSFSEVRINSVAAEDSEEFVTLDLDLRRKFSADLKVKVDTGAQGNTLPLRIFKRMFPEKLNDAGLPDPRMISRSQTILTTYDGNRLEQLGCITIPCQYSNRSCRDVSFYIVDVEGPAILGLPDLKAFKIVTIHHAIDAAEPVKCTKDLVKMYPKQFDGPWWKLLLYGLRLRVAVVGQCPKHQDLPHRHLHVLLDHRPEGVLLVLGGVIAALVALEIAPGAVQQTAVVAANMASTPL